MPTPPVITTDQVIRQFKMDIYGKEVQSAATYSYLWIAAQVGHIGVGIMVQFLFYCISYYLLPRLNFSPDFANLSGLALIVSAVAFWEWSTYRSAIKRHTGSFKLNRKGLRNNALTATLYMWLGGLIGFSFQLAPGYGLSMLIACLLIAFIPVSYWMRQKMIWQKASLPYLFRLADMKLDEQYAGKIQQLLDETDRLEEAPRQIIIEGTLGSGRTRLAVGIGSEFSFKKRKVRYLPFDKLVELVNSNDSYPGPKNVDYWPWADAEVLVIDDVAATPLPHTEQSPVNEFDHFSQLLQEIIGHNPTCLKQRHTVWVLADIEEPSRWIDEIKSACGNNGGSEPIIVSMPAV
ncbi:MAG: hypothetical protein RPU64_08140 [Candidatus Sedimenticola sp. (ex Thyasira tokunagai)]